MFESQLIARPGGARPGAGRKPGGKNKSTVERELRAEHGVQAAIATGIMPLDVLLTVMRGGPEAAAISERQYEAAVAAAPYLHAKLAATTLKGDRDQPLAIENVTDSRPHPRDFARAILIKHGYVKADDNDEAVARATEYLKRHECEQKEFAR